MIKLKLRPLLFCIILTTFVFVDVPSRINVFNYSFNALISIFSSALLSLGGVWAFPKASKKVPLSWWIFTAWMSVMLFYSFLHSGNLTNQVNYQLSAGIQQYITWLLFFSSFLIGIRIGNDKQIYKSFLISLIVTSLFWLFFTIIFDPSLGTRPQAAFLALLTSVFYAHFRSKRKIKWLVLTLLLVGGIVISGSRMAALASALAIAVSELYDFRIPNVSSWRRIGLIAVMAVFFISAAFLYQPFKERIIETGESLLLIFSGDGVPSAGSLSRVTQGRSIVWPKLIKEALNQPLVGHGVGTSSAYAFYYSKNARFTHAHNEYIRIFFDTGIIGLIFFTTGFISVGLRLRRSVMAHKLVRPGIDRHNGIVISGLGALAVTLALFFTDNVGLYSFFMAPMGFLLGMSVANIDYKKT